MAVIGKQFSFFCCLEMNLLEILFKRLYKDGDAVRHIYDASRHLNDTVRHEYDATRHHVFYGIMKKILLYQGIYASISSYLTYLFTNNKEFRTEVH